MNQRSNQQIILDSSGDARHGFDPDNGAGGASAKMRFEGLIERGYSAFDKKNGRRVDRFDPTAETTLFVPRLKGG